MYPSSLEDMIIWADDSWCYREELHDFTWKSDDYRVVSVHSPEYDSVRDSLS